MPVRIVPSPLKPSELVRVGATIREMRTMRGMSQEDLSRASLLSRAYVANIEAGRKKASGKAIARIAAALHVPQISIIVPSDEDAA